MSISRIDSLPLMAPEALRPTEEVGSTAEAPAGVSFENILGDALHEANRLDFQASQKTQQLAAGVIDDIHGTMIAVKEADISVKLVGTVRNKILEAFQELWKTSV